MAGFNNQCRSCKYSDACKGAHGSQRCDGYSSKKETSTKPLKQPKKKPSIRG